jgi:hypothetical protein
MPPKKNPIVDTSDEQDMYAMIKSMSVKLNSFDAFDAKLNSIDAKMEKVETIEQEVKHLRVLMEDLKNENKQLKAEVKEKDKQLKDMQEELNRQDIRINNIDQHHRGWSARVMNIPLTEEEEWDTNTVIGKVYEMALLPILKGAHDCGKLTTIPTAHQLLETAHVLPGNTKPGQHKPVIFRFYTRSIKDLCFKLKKEYATRVQQTTGEERREMDEVDGAGAGAGGVRRKDGGGYKGKGKYAFPFYEDLTKANFNLMRNLANDSRVQASWSSHGQIYFKLQNSNTVKKVGSIHEPLDSILK